MKLLILLPLLVTSTTTTVPEKYALVVDGVDDVLDCSLNGLAVAHFTFGQSGTVPLATRKGPNSLVCVPKDTGRAGGHACWAYRYRIFKNWEEMAKIYSSCCSPGCPDQPTPIRTDFSTR